MPATIRFEQSGASLTGFSVERDSRSPVVASLHHALLALGIIIASYQVQPRANGLVERVVIQRRDGGSVEGTLSDQAKAAVLPIALEVTSGEQVG